VGWFSAPADHALGAVGGRGVDEVDAEAHGLVNEPRGFVLGFPGLQAESAEAAGAEAATLTRRLVWRRVV